ncbi:MAG: hypothetical protein ABH950_04945, partial [Candidatus Altiarchaeota archaeon]
MWQLGIFNMGGTAVTSSGFARLKPQLSACSLVAVGNSRFVFTNGAGASITLSTLKVMTDVGGATSVLAQPALGTTSAAGDNFAYDIAIPGTAAGDEGSPIGADIDITYTIVVAGDVIGHIEHGTIRGPLE